MLASDKNRLQQDLLLPDSGLEDQPASLRCFIEHFDAEPAMQRAPEDQGEYRHSLIRGLWELGQHRPLGDFRVEVSNPEQSNGEAYRTWVQLVSADMPFLVQSLLLMLRRQGLSCYQLVHPIMGIRRTADGRLLEVRSRADDGEAAEVFIHLELERISEAVRRDLLTQDLYRVLYDVRSVNRGWQPCLDRLAAIRLGQTCRGLDNHAEVDRFLQWLANDHFVFLGYRQYQIIRQGGRPVRMLSVDGSGLGLLGDERHPPHNVSLTRAAADKLLQSQPLLICKASSRSVVHRDAFMDYIGIQCTDDQGQLVGEHRFLGLFSATVFHCELQTIPLLGNKIERVRKASGFQPGTYNWRTLNYVLEELPREELFYMAEERLLEVALGVMRLMERPDVGVFFFADAYAHFASVLIYIPRERYHTRVRQQLQRLLQGAYQTSEADFTVQMGDSALAQVRFSLHSELCSLSPEEQMHLQQRIAAVLYDWRDGLHLQLLRHFDETVGNRLFARYAEAFSDGYCHDYSPGQAVLDIERLELLANSRFQSRLHYSELEGEDGSPMAIRMYCLDQPAALSDSLPMLENLGVRVINEHPYSVRHGSTQAWLHHIELSYSLPELIDSASLAGRFEAALAAVWFNRMENDRFNQLVISAGLGWRQVTLFRALFCYSRQIGQWFSLEYTAHILDENPAAVRALWQLFAQRFAGEGRVADSGKPGNAGDVLQAIIDESASLDEERVLCRYQVLILAMQRCNYFVSEESGKQELAFKFDPALIDDLPAPRPLHEIFVYAVDFEGVHLRAGDIARGGLRWSDRREDFRTEILGLMKAQVNKNAVIVPTGAKGGFVIKAPTEAMPQSEIQETLKDCYQRYIRTLLDLTDNIDASGQTVRPAGLVCHDKDDSYLVVAADKGTAALSDYANAVSKDYGFWLGDAFASGGSVGYDHKQMGITARGAWESVKHHLLELGHDIDSRCISVVGIGDMSGDVFGNGMLLSRQIRLQAAFNHLHIFVDPSPDPDRSYRERLRLFRLPRSSWADYDEKLISSGGGVFSRKAKSIPLSDAMRELTGSSARSLSPDQLIRLLLMAPVDLLWNGGIGTYVRASHEQDSVVGDRSNDGVRVTGGQLQCRVVGEGGNLGFTQAARVEYALQGGRINTDSIDNSAGVDCSDHEVNIKILLRGLMEQGLLEPGEREVLLHSMTDEVMSLVLVHNYQQTRAISLVEQQSRQRPAAHIWLLEQLEQQAPLDRALENLPDSATLNERQVQGGGLLRPEIAVIMAYTKSYLKQQLQQEATLLQSDLGERAVADYFPETLKKLGEIRWQQHPLYAAIAANSLVNSMVNRLGLLFPMQLLWEDNYALSDIMHAYALAARLCDAESLWNGIDQLDGKVDAVLQAQLAVRVSDGVRSGMECLLANHLLDAAGSSWLPQLQSSLETLSGLWPGLTASEQETAPMEDSESSASNLPGELASRFASLENWPELLEIACLALEEQNTPVDEVARLYVSLDQKLGFGCLRRQVAAIPVNDRWQWLARRALQRDLRAGHHDLAARVMHSDSKQTAAERIELWQQCCQDALGRYLALYRSVQADERAGLNAMTVLLGAMRPLLSIK